MAIRASAAPKVGSVRVISSIDEALDWTAMSKEDWKKYQEDAIANEGLLKYKPDQLPTVFLCNFEFDGKEGAVIKNYMVGGGDKFENAQKVTMGSWAYMVCKYALKEIQNPPGVKDGLELKRDGADGGRYVGDETMSVLTRLGVVEEIFGHYLNLTQKDQTRASAKN